MKVKEVMTKEVKSVGFDTPLKEVAQTLAEARISGVPVLSAAGRVVGVVSEADILYKERTQSHERGGLFGLLLSGETLEAEAKLNARTAGEAMSAPAITIGPLRPVAEAAATMLDEQVNRLPVVDDDGALLGIVTRADLVKAFLRSDAEIAAEIRDDVILRTLWIAPESINVTVDRGEVTLSGAVETQSDAELVAEFAQRVPGVVAVVSKLSWQVEGDGNGNGRRKTSILARQR